MTLTPPVNHVGITVPDIYAAIDWYVEVFGFEHIMGPRVLEAASSATAETGAILGPRFQRAFQAHLLSANGVGLELFQFVEPPVTEPDRELVYWRPGPWHVCFTYEDLPAKVADILNHGGRQISPIITFVPGRSFELIYCQDPWGTTLELMSHPYADVFSGWPQTGMTEVTTWLKRDGSTYTGDKPL